MAIKPPPLGEVIQQVNDLVGSSGIREEVDKNARALAQSALSRLDVVNREEFDAQAEFFNTVFYDALAANQNGLGDIIIDNHLRCLESFFFLAFCIYDSFWIALSAADDGAHDEF